MQAHPQPRCELLPLTDRDQPVNRGAALWRGFAALQTENVLWDVVVWPLESTAVIVRR
jgi:hypothetical protein